MCIDHKMKCECGEEPVKPARIDPKKYFEEVKKWGPARMDRLALEGWRKANEG